MCCQNFTLNAGLEVPSRHKLQKQIFHRNEAFKARLQVLISEKCKEANHGGRLVLNDLHWYICTAADWIDETWKMRSFSVVVSAVSLSLYLERNVCNVIKAVRGVRDFIQHI